MSKMRVTPLWLMTIAMLFVTYKILSHRMSTVKNAPIQAYPEVPQQREETKEFVPEQQYLDVDDLKIKKRKQWSSLQSQLKDAVVQVFSQISDFNWLEPYKTPNQMEARGSASFINSAGELMTNAHVVNQASVIFIQIPSLGKERFEVEIVGISPDRDLALLKLTDESKRKIVKGLGRSSIPHLKWGDSDSVCRADNIMVSGFPLGHQGLKCTTGVVSGFEHVEGQYYIQISAPINPGNSGGAALNDDGELVGIPSAGIMQAQNVGFVIPSNEAKLFYEQLQAMPENADGSPKLLRKPYLGVLFNNANDNLTKFLGNPLPGGLYVADVFKGSSLYKAGIKAGDMLYKINGYDIDVYGELNAPWLQEDKISIIDYISRLKTGEDVHIEYYDKGTPKEIKFQFGTSELLPVRRVFPAYEKVEHENIGGMVIMQLTLNHILLLAQYSPELVKYADFKKHQEPKLIVTHHMLNSPIVFSRTFSAGSLISEINGEKVGTLSELRKAMQKSKKDGYLTVKTTENFFVALPLDEIVSAEPRLSRSNKYEITPGAKELLAAA